MNDPLTYRYKRTLVEAFGCDATQAVAIHKYKPPLHRRFFYALIRTGWMLVVLALAAAVLTGCDDTQAEEATAASLRDALAQAQQESPEQWTAERRARADAAAGLVARGVQP
ncbi:hypothetical protein LJR074_001940 [Acidovorax sp. LjRoot74]|uniref:hypothetical protein n=1 Tax=Acidovorax sp. LjRoot74 TaxID=3342337 RepID=UPI003ECCFF72